MIRIRKHIADGSLDILDVLHTMVLLRVLPSSYSILVVALSGEANLTRLEVWSVEYYWKRNARQPTTRG